MGATKLAHSQATAKSRVKLGRTTLNERHDRPPRPQGFGLCTGLQSLNYYSLYRTCVLNSTYHFDIGITASAKDMAYLRLLKGIA